MKRSLALALLAAALIATVSACGSKTVTTTNANGSVTTRTVANIHFAKTKFLLHMGLAFGAFHHYIEKPYREGAFRKGASGRGRAIVKAAGAAVFATHELKGAREDALSDEHLRPLAEKIERLLHRLTHLGATTKGGSFSLADVAAASALVTHLGSLSSGLGAGIKDVVPSL